MKTAEQILSKHKSIPEQNLIHVSSVIEAMEQYKDECILYCGHADWEGVAAANIQELKLALDGYQDLVDICTAIYKYGDKEALKEMINECIGGDAHERFKNHLGV